MLLCCLMTAGSRAGSRVELVSLLPSTGLWAKAVSFLLLQILSQLRCSVNYKLFRRGSSSSILSLQRGTGSALGLLEQLSGSDY